jgi:hypothetical protein
LTPCHPSYLIILVSSSTPFLVSPNTSTLLPSLILFMKLINLKVMISHESLPMVLVILIYKLKELLDSDVGLDACVTNLNVNWKYTAILFG